VTIMFRGREREHPERGRDLLMRLAEELKELGTIETQPLLEGRNMTMVMAPTRTAGVTTDAKDEDEKRSEEALQGDGDGQAPAPGHDEEPQSGAQVGEAEAEVRSR
jgi:translation initiation factor IF-3